MNKLNIIKRNGTTEEFNPDKIHRVLEWATDGITGVSISQIVATAHLKLFDGMHSDEIHKSLISSSEELISEETPNYDQPTSRLITFDLYKRVFGDYMVPDAQTHFNKMVDAGLYDREFAGVNDTEWQQIDKVIKHDRDYTITTAGMKQFIKKFLVSDRVTGQVKETPQFLYARMALALALQESPAEMVAYFKEYYDEFSTFNINNPSPWLNGLGTPTRQFSSCVLIDAGDSIESISEVNKAVMKYITKRAGIGVNYGRLRPIGSPIRGGEAVHTGITGFLRALQETVNCCSQGNFRKGSATVHMPIWHYEIPDVIELKDNSKTYDSLVPFLDYSIGVTRYFFEKIISGEDVYLLNPSEHEGLYDAFHKKDESEFIELYEKACRKKNVQKRKVNFRELFTNTMVQRKETGRYYFFFPDNVNKQSPFMNSIYMSNLCQEIQLVTEPLVDSDDKEGGEIAICTIAAINLGKFKTPEDMRHSIRLTVRALDTILDYQDYPVAAALKAKDRRNLGVGIMNLAYWMAKRGFKYQDDSALEEIHRWMEHMMYYLIEASVDLAIERGKCELFEDTTYSKGQLPIDWYNKNVDSLVPHKLELDWEDLRQRVKDHGMRHSTLAAQMPGETSSLIQGSTSGIEPVRSLVTIKGNKDLKAKVLVPEITRLKNKYDMLWDQKDPRGYLNVMAVIQKFFDQAMSTNISYNPYLFDDNKIPMSKMIGDVMYAHKFGLKTLYYQNTMKMQSEESEDKVGQEPELIERDDEVCESCSI